MIFEIRDIDVHFSFEWGNGVMRCGTNNEA
jgi:hypothetical protein